MSDPHAAAELGRIRTVVGLVAGLMLIASSAAHSALGWPSLQARLVTAHAPVDLIIGLGIGWQFAGGAMLVLGTLVVWTYADVLRGRPASLRLPSLVSLFYLLFGAWSFVVSNYESFFVAVFIVPGALLAAAAWPRRRAPSLL